MCMEQSMRYPQEHHCQLLTTTMFPVLCVMLQQGWQSQRSLLKPGVHQHGFWSILATSCQSIVIIIAPCTSVLTKTQTQSQAVLPIQMVLCFTPLKPAAMACCVHPMIPRKNSPVLFVPNRGHICGSAVLHVGSTTLWRAVMITTLHIRIFASKLHSN